MTYNKTTQDVVSEVLPIAEKKGMLGDLVLLVEGLGQLEILELYGVATLLGVNLAGGEATVNKKLLRQMEMLGYGEEFSFLSEQSTLKCNTQIIEEVLHAFLNETDERRDNLLVLIREALEDGNNVGTDDVEDLDEVDEVIEGEGK